MIMLCFAEVGTRITSTGGAYTYIEKAFGGFAGFLTANIFIFGAALTANAAVANGLADTLSYFFPFFKLQATRILFFAVIFGILAYFNVKGIKNAVMIVKVNTIAKLVPLAIILVFGWFYIHGGIRISFTSSLNNIGQVALILLFAYVGAETALNVSGEILRPEKTVPRGILISIFLVVIIYALIQVVVQSILGDSMSLHRDAPLAATAKIMFGSAGALMVIVGATFSMFGNISGMVMNMPRILYAAAKDRVVPSAGLAKVHPEYRTPHYSIIMYAMLGFVFSSIGEFKLLAMLSSASYMLIYLGVVCSAIRFRMKEKTHKKFTGIVRGYIIPFFSATIILWVLTKLPVKELIGMMIFMAILTFIYQIMRHIRRKKV